MLTVGSRSPALSVLLQQRLASTATPPSPPPKDFLEYITRQRKLENKQRAPVGDETFEDLQAPHVAFRDFTPFFEIMRVFDPTPRSSTALLRGRRWGKSTLGNAWLAYLRKEEKLFEGTAVQGKMRAEPLIGVHLDISRTATTAGVLSHVAKRIQEGLNRANVSTSWKNPLPPDFRGQPVAALSEYASDLLDSLYSVSEAENRKFALFIDEYDSLCIRRLQQANDDTTSKEVRAQAFEEYQQTNEFFAHFYTSLKEEAGRVIPFQFTTGSSRLALKGFWSGANAITDLSFNPEMAAVLGYTWEQIEHCFPTQLDWLQELHGLTREQLRIKMEEWYDNHRWSPRSSEHVFNPWSVHAFIRSGEFEPYWSGTGANTRLLNSRLLMKDLLKSLVASPENRPDIIINSRHLENSRMPTEAGEALDNEGQKALLVGAGMLAIHPAETNTSGELRLTIPNLDAEAAIRELVATAVTVPLSFSESLITPFFLANDWAGLLNAMNSTGALKDMLNDLTNPGQAVSEELITQAIASLLIARKPDLILLRPSAPLPTSNQGRPPTADLVYHVDSTRTTNILEIKMASTRQTGGLGKQLLAALEQCVKYKATAKKGYQVLHTVVIFAKPSPDSNESPSTVEAVTLPLTEAQIGELRNTVDAANSTTTCNNKKEANKLKILQPYCAILDHQAEQSST